MTREHNFGLAGFERQLSDHELTRDLAAFEQAVVDIREFPPGNSKVVEACMEATLQDLHNESFPEFNQTVLTFLRDRPDMSAHLKVQLFWRVFQHSLIKSSDNINYPADYAKVMTWQKAFRSILEDAPNAINPDGWEVQELLATHTVQTNEPRRYSGVKIAIDAYSDIIGQEPSYVDAGCSAGLGQIQIGENIPFRGVNIDTRKREVRHRVRSGLNKQISFSKIVGFDMISGTSIEWVDACSNPKELADTARNRDRRKYREHLGTHRKYYKRLHGDLSEGDPGIKAVMDENNGQKYDVASALTMLYEIPVDLQTKATKTLEYLSKCLVVVVDFAEISHEDPTQLITAKNIYAPGSRYRLLAKELTGDNLNWQHLGTFDNGRCTSFKPEKILLKRYVDLGL
jgi:hypothetical protein